MLLPLWARAVIGLALVKGTFGLVMYLAAVGPVPVTSFAPVWIFALLAAAFAVVGGLLLLGGIRSDIRAAWLGGLLVLIASALAPGANRFEGDSSWLPLTRPDAFLPAFFWRFVIEFPSRLAGVAARAAHAVGHLASIAGVVVCAANLSLIWWPALPAGDWRTPVLQTAPTGTMYWLFVFGVSILALPVLLWRTGTASASERPQAQLFVRCLALGLMPLALEVVAEQLFPAYDALTSRPIVRTIVGAVLFTALGTVPFTTAYSVLFDQVVRVSVVLRAALQHLLARYTIAALTAVPFAALALFLYSQRAQPLEALFSGPRPLALIGIIGIGLVTLRMRHRWILAVDRRYFREPYDAKEILARIVGELQAQTPELLADAIAHELDRALHVDVGLLMTNEARTALRDVRGVQTPLAASATLVQFAMNDAMPLEINLADVRSALRRLPEIERRWLDANRVRLVAGLRGGDGRLSGLLTLSEKRSGLAFSGADHQLVSAVAAAASLALDNLRLRSSPTPSDPPAQECLQCSRLHGSDVARCGCGGTVAEAPVPHVLRGAFRLDQRLGAGGMGVVYRAFDLNLGRDVAIKTLPRVSHAQGALLKQEARAMAKVTHPHLAAVFGIESWRDVPFVVEEYLAGGTLAQRLERGRFGLPETIALGVAMASALDQLHSARLLHCDVKPSNIGFTDRDVPKLLDFGLARVLREAEPATDLVTTSDALATPALITVTTHGRLAGTPHYMSPESVQGLPQSPSTDIWSLVVVLFECLAGRRPFEGTSVSEVFAGVLAKRRPRIVDWWPECPPPVEALFTRAFRLEPTGRFATAAALGDALRALRSDAYMR